MSSVITLITSNKFLPSNGFIYHEFNGVAIFNIPHTNILSSSICFYHFSFSFYEYSFFTNRAFYDIFNSSSVTNYLSNDFYITYLFDRDNRNYEVTEECINIFYQIKNKSNTSKICITSDNNVFFLKTIFVIFRVFNRKQREYLKLCYLAIFLIVIYPILYKFQIKDGFSFNFTALQKCSTNAFFNLKIITSCHYIQHITLHKNLVCLAITNLKYKDYKNFY